MTMNKITTYIICSFTAVLGICLIGCNNDNRFDKGYEAAWEDEEAPSSFWTSKEEKEGYEQGLDDVWMYNEGYYDGVNGKKPKYFNDPFYMDGFKDGKVDK